MTLGNGIVIGILGRYASSAAQPFPPRIKSAGITLTPRAKESAVEALQAAWESTTPWSPAAELQQKAQVWLERVLVDNGYVDVEVQVTVVENIPFHVR